MPQPLLPKLKPTHNIGVFNESGTWDVRGRDSLNLLSKGLKVDKLETEISSIPDMWARPMLFEMALFNKEHALHQRILGEWRGLLAMIALKEVLGLNRLTATQVTLPVIQPPQNGESQEENASEQRDFLLTLAKLLPEASLAADTSWRTLYIFLFNGQPIGMTSPTTLVVTAADYLNRISAQEVDWYNGTHLKDPSQTLPPLHKSILSGWLNNLINSIGAHGGLDIGRWNLLAGLLRNFKNDLGDGTCNLSLSRFGIQGPGAGIFKYLDRPADENIQNTSHVRLIPSEDRTPTKPLLVFDRSIAEQWDIPAQNVTVDRALTLASAQVKVQNAEVWRAADFFTKKLFVIYQENAFPNTLAQQSLTLPGGSTIVTPILPLRQELMQYLTAEDLAQRLRWEQTPEGIRVHLLLQLSGPDPEDATGRPAEVVSNLYRREDIQTLDNVPILEIWPDFQAAGWNAYYSCYSTDDVKATFTAKPFTLGEAKESEVQLGGRRRRRYWLTESYPEAIICQAVVPNTQTGQLDPHDAGLLLLTCPQKEVQAQGTTYHVGVDFGATSTTICARVGQQPLTVNFANRKVSVTASGDRAQAQLFDFFLPRQESEMPVLSFFQDFFNNSAAEELRPFLDGHAYLLETAELFDPNTKGLAYDLKWSANDQDRKRVRAFLTQLCLQTAAELINRGATGASWSFSYPTAFNDEQIEGFPGIWSQVIADCAKQSGLRAVSPAKSRRTESEATALYFVKHKQAATDLGTVFIDIGGSTSDISVWQKRRPVWQTSVLLAGRSIFSAYLWHHPEFLGLFGLNVSRLSEVKNQQGTDRRPYYALTDALLRYNSERIFQQLPVHAGTGPVKALRQHLALGVSGLFYYVGSLLQYLMRKGIYQQEVPNVYVGGNGSRIFRWLDIDGDERINALYKAVFAQGAGWTDEKAFRVVLSPEPKREAAFGLIYDDDLPAGNEERKVLAGESFIAEGTIEEWGSVLTEGKREDGKRKFAWDNVLTPTALTLNLSPPQKLDRLSDFVTTFNRFANNRGLVSATTFSTDEETEVRRQLSQSMSTHRGATDVANIIVEPLFIMALRDWLEIRLGRRA